MVKVPTVGINGKLLEMLEVRALLSNIWQCLSVTMVNLHVIYFVITAQTALNILAEFPKNSRSLRCLEIDAIVFMIITVHVMQKLFSTCIVSYLGPMIAWNHSLKNT